MLAAIVFALNVELARAAAKQVGVTTIYDPSYVQLRYPGGDLPKERGVCADVIIRAMRGIGVDLQREVHEDMRKHFDAYPQVWGLRGPDANIDHRRVPNLMAYFRRRGKTASADFQAGDIVAWRLPGGYYHIGIIGDDGRLVIHNIGRGAQKEDILHAFPIIGHYRW
ncbi:MAG TPA: DUF1287 domain-containing protein [Thermoanaerobaculia bacterium]|nr:DUF1287 domain-containing protein [Thermoanaerobaculia bacterium]